MPPALFLPISREKWGPPPGRRGPGALRPKGASEAPTLRVRTSGGSRPPAPPGGPLGAGPKRSHLPMTVGPARPAPPGAAPLPEILRDC